MTADRLYCRNPDACTAAKPTTHCRSCMIQRSNLDPDLQARRRAALRGYYDDPDNQPAIRERAQAAARTIMAQPDAVERRRERGRRQMREVLDRPDLRARDQAPEARAAAGRTNSARRLKDVPLEYRPLYRALLRQGIKKAEAMSLVRAQMAADLARYRATGQLQQSAAAT